MIAPANRPRVRRISVLAVQLAALVAVLIGTMVFFVRFVAAPTPHSTPQTVNLTIIVEPGGSQQVNGYLESGDRMALSWRTDGADLGYRYHVESGHETPSILAIGLSSDGAQQFKAEHGGFYGIGLRNFTGRRVTVTLKATGTFEYFRAMFAQGKREAPK
ncbi:hypothetical protein [Sphingobium chungbukense]|uniref:hypothetical protein n=1 Tax=Sphingobium chungbukense TaxID=56193 RepID=UPI000AB5946B|nr:hypothetical protein [Sphingobium chungbukense]